MDDFKHPTLTIFEEEMQKVDEETAAEAILAKAKRLVDLRDYVQRSSSICYLAAEICGLFELGVETTDTEIFVDVNTRQATLGVRVVRCAENLVRPQTLETLYVRAHGFDQIDGAQFTVETTRCADVVEALRVVSQFVYKALRAGADTKNTAA